MSTDALIIHAQSRLGERAVRAFTEADSIDGGSAQLVAEPATADEVAAVLGWASAEQLTVAVRGGGTKLDWGGVCQSVDLIVSTAAPEPSHRASTRRFDGDGGRRDHARHAERYAGDARTVVAA